MADISLPELSFLRNNSESKRRNTFRVGFSHETSLLTPDMETDLVYLPEVFDIDKNPVVGLFQNLTPTNRSRVSNVLMESVENYEKGELRDETGALMEPRDLSSKTLVKVLGSIHKKIRSSNLNNNLRGGAEALLVKIDKNSDNEYLLSLASVGQSRVYLHRSANELPSRYFEPLSEKNSLSLINRPQSTQEMESTEIADSNPHFRSNLKVGSAKVLGEKGVVIGSELVALKNNDVILIASEGLRIPKKTINIILDEVAQGKKSPQKATQELIENMKRRGLSSDATAIILSVGKIYETDAAKQKGAEYLLSVDQIKALEKVCTTLVPSKTPEPLYWYHYQKASVSLPLTQRGIDEIGDEFVRRVYKRLGLVDKVMKSIGVTQRPTPALAKAIMNWAEGLEYNLYNSRDFESTSEELGARYKEFLKIIDLANRIRILERKSFRVPSEKDPNTLIENVDEKRLKLRKLGEELKIW